MNLLFIRAMNPIKYALSLMDALFTYKEIGSHCYSRGKRGTKEELPGEKVQLMKGI